MAIHSLKHVAFLACLAALAATIVQADAAADDGGKDDGEWFRHPRKPNIIIFNADDMGWGDFSSYGHPTQEWGPIDDMAREGMRFTNMYASAPICTPSRSGLMTGRLAVRIGTYGLGRVFWPTSTNGLPREEITIAEALKEEGYSTGMVGKWHLGVNAYDHNDGSHLPYNHGFDYVGLNLPLSNGWFCDEEQWHFDKPVEMMCMIYDNATNVQQPYSHYEMTERFVSDAIGFMREAHKNREPFFLYFPLAQPHVDLFNNAGFVGSSIRGRYGDNIREMAWAVGAVMDEVKRLGKDESTISYFTSDNGPHLQLCNEGGDAGVFKGGKMQYWEGGIRIPGIIRWPGHIKAGTVNNELTSQLDIFPTFMRIIGGKMPTDRAIDGQDISRMLFKWRNDPEPEPISGAATGQNGGQIPAKIQRHSKDDRLLVFHCRNIRYAARYGSYKFHFFTQDTWTKEGNAAFPGRCGDGGFPLDNNVDCGACDRPECVVEHDPPVMYNVDKDPNEAYPLNITLAEHQVVLKKMLAALAEFEAGLVIAPPLLDSRSSDTIPCCSPETFPVCNCNYPGDYPPGDYPAEEFEKMPMDLDMAFGTIFD